MPTSPSPAHWIVKQEPAAYAWNQFVKDGETAWTGVRNFQARNNLRAMKTGDIVLYYHSVTGRELVGIATVKREAYPDPSATEGDWVCVDLVPVSPLPQTVSLDTLKKHPLLSQTGLVRQSRLSVIPLSPNEYQAIITLASKA